jgi:hypothetical protein
MLRLVGVVAVTTGMMDVRVCVCVGYVVVVG